MPLVPDFLNKFFFMLCVKRLGGGGSSNEAKNLVMIHLSLSHQSIRIDRPHSAKFSGDPGYYYANVSNACGWNISSTWFEIECKLSSSPEFPPVLVGKKLGKPGNKVTSK